jgi:Flp pilus assembly protein TadG
MSGGIRNWRDETRRRGRSLLARARRDPSGGVSIVFALSIVFLAIIVYAGVEMTQLFSERSQMRGVADSAALWGASALALTGEEGVAARTKAFAETQLSKMSLSTAPTVTAQVVNLSSDPSDPKPALKVTVEGQRQSFLGDLISAGGFRVAVSSTALTVSKMPLCILATANTNTLVGDILQPVLKQSVGLQDASKIDAQGCLIQSNADIKVASAASIKAGVVQTVGSAAGTIDPKARTGAKIINDPFTNIQPPSNLTCKLTGILANLDTIKLESGTTTLPAGVHQAPYELRNDAVVVLAPGEHMFCRDFKAMNASKVTGDDVALVFDTNSKFEFKDQSVVDLKGRQSGPLAGFVIYSKGNQLKDFIIQSEHVGNLLGTIYLPQSQLVIVGKGDVAKQSDWTVIVAKAVKLQGNPILYINSDYAGSVVPVPAGVGAKSMDSRIVK